METHTEEPEPVFIRRRELKKGTSAKKEPTVIRRSPRPKSAKKGAAEPTVSEHVEVSMPPSQGWTNEAVKMLLSGMLKNMPESRSWASGQKTMRWDRVAFPPYTAEMCLKKWVEISKPIPKIRNLTELVKEAQGAFENPFKKDGCKIYKHVYHNFPKRPAAPTALFYRENRDELKKQHPELKSFELMKLALRKYVKLPEKEKARYTEKTHRAKEEYLNSMALLREQYPDLECSPQKARNSGKPQSVKKRKKDPALKASSSNSASVTETQLKLKRGLSHIPRPHSLFCSEQMLEAAPSHVKEPSRRFALISASWRNLPKEQKEIYQQRQDSMKKECIREFQNAFNNLSETEKEKFWKENPSKHCLLEYSPKRTSGKRHTFLDDKIESIDSVTRHIFFDQNEEGSKGKSSRRTSDSEDDDIQIDTTSSEDDDPHECEDENVNAEGAPLEDWTSSSGDDSSSEGDQ